MSSLPTCLAPLRLRLVSCVVACVSAAGCAGSPPTPVLRIPAPRAAPTLQPAAIAEKASPQASCALHGKRLGFDGDALDLCAKPHVACYARMTSDRSVWTVSLEARDGETGARVTIDASTGIRVWGVADAKSLWLHATKPALVSGFYVPDSAPLHAVLVHDGSMDFEVAAGDDTIPASPIRGTERCANLTTDPPRFDLDEVQALLGLGEPQAQRLLAHQTIRLHEALEGPMVARLEGRGQPATVYETRGQWSRVIVTLERGYAWGWVLESLLAPRLTGSHRTHALRYHEPHSGPATCPKDVEILADVQGDLVHIGTIPAGIAFDPSAPSALLAASGFTVINGAAILLRGDPSCTKPP